MSQANEQEINNNNKQLKTITIMTKKELRAEIENLQKAYGLRYYSGINSMKKAELESFLSDIKYAHSLK